MLKLNCEGVAGSVASISPTAAGHKRNHWPLINVSAGDVERHSRFCILPPSPAISDAEEIKAKVTFYVGK